MRIDIGEIHCLVEEKEIHDVHWIGNENQQADGLTKKYVEIENVMYMLG